MTVIFAYFNGIYFIGLFSSTSVGAEASPATSESATPWRVLAVLGGILLVTAVLLCLMISVIVGALLSKKRVKSASHQARRAASFRIMMTDFTKNTTLNPVDVAAAIQATRVIVEGEEGDEENDRGGGSARRGSPSTKTSRRGGSARDSRKLSAKAQRMMKGKKVESQAASLAKPTPRKPPRKAGHGKGLPFPSLGDGALQGGQSQRPDIRVHTGQLGRISIFKRIGPEPLLRKPNAGTYICVKHPLFDALLTGLRVVFCWVTPPPPPALCCSPTLEISFSFSLSFLK